MSLLPSCTLTGRSFLRSTLLDAVDDGDALVAVLVDRAIPEGAHPLDLLLVREQHRHHSRYDLVVLDRDAVHEYPVRLIVFMFI